MTSRAIDTSYLTDAKTITEAEKNALNAIKTMNIADVEKSIPSVRGGLLLGARATALSALEIGLLLLRGLVEQPLETPRRSCSDGVSSSRTDETNDAAGR